MCHIVSNSLKAMKCLNCFVIFLYLIHHGHCWTTEDMELFDLVENTPRNFYDVLGVDPKASASDIRKAYRKLSTLYHPDKNRQSNAEETFRRIAAVADVLRNDERRKTYDLILKTGLPDWRAPIYYYRRVRNMGLFELTIFLFLLATFAQYLFAWSSYWERKYEIEEVVLSRLRKKAKSQKRGKKVEIDEDATVEEVMATLQKPRCQDLFPFRLFAFFIHVIKSSPSYVATCKDYIKHRKKSVTEEIEEEEPQYEVRVRPKKQAKTKVIPDYTTISSYDESDHIVTSNIVQKTECETKQKQKWSWESLTEQQVVDFKKAIKKFPVGTLQRWEKVAAFLDCEVSEVVSMIKEMKNQQVSKSIPASMQGVTGNEKENFGCELYTEKGAKSHETENSVKLSNGSCANGTIVSKDTSLESEAANSEKYWKQEEQRSLEVALQKYPKDTPARWDKIATFVSSKSREECIERYKILAQQVKKKKDKTV